MKLEKVKFFPSTNSSSTNTYVIFSKEREEKHNFIALLERESWQERNIKNTLVFVKRGNPEFYGFLGAVLLELTAYVNTYLEETNKIKEIILEITGQKIDSLFVRRAANVREEFYAAFLNEFEDKELAGRFFINELFLPKNKKTGKVNFSLFKLILKRIVDKTNTLFVLTDISEDSFPSPKQEIFDYVINKMPEFIRKEVGELLEKYSGDVVGYKEFFSIRSYERSAEKYYKVFENKVITYTMPPFGITAVYRLTDKEMEEVLNDSAHN